MKGPKRRSVAASVRLAAASGLAAVWWLLVGATGADAAQLPDPALAEDSVTQLVDPFLDPVPAPGEEPATAAVEDAVPPVPAVEDVVPPEPTTTIVRDAGDLTGALVEDPVGDPLAPVDELTGTVGTVAGPVTAVVDESLDGTLDTVPAVHGLLPPAPTTTIVRDTLDAADRVTDGVRTATSPVTAPVAAVLDDTSVMPVAGEVLEPVVRGTVPPVVDGVLPSPPLPATVPPPAPSAPTSSPTTVLPDVPAGPAPAAPPAEGPTTPAGTQPGSGPEASPAEGGSSARPSPVGPQGAGGVPPAAPPAPPLSPRAVPGTDAGHPVVESAPPPSDRARAAAGAVPAPPPARAAPAALAASVAPFHGGPGSGAGPGSASLPGPAGASSGGPGSPFGDAGTGSWPGMPPDRISVELCGGSAADRETARARGADEPPPPPVSDPGCTPD